MTKPSLIIGRQPVIEAMEAGRPVDKILIQQQITGEVIAQIRKMAQERQIPLQQVPPQKLQSLTRANHQGVIALAALVSYHDLQQVIDWIVGEGKLPFLVMLDGITDVRNIGAIARSAHCFGAQALLLPDKGVGALNEEAMKSSAGALAKIAICRESSLLKAVDLLHQNGFQIFASAMKAPVALEDLDFNHPACLILGSEDKGVQPYLLKAADHQFRIPMESAFDSLNVSVAAGVTLYAAMKGRAKIQGN